MDRSLSASVSSLPIMHNSESYILYRRCNLLVLNLHTGVNIFINLVSLNLEYLEWTLDRIWNTESGRLFLVVRREFHSPLVTKPAS